MGFLLIFSLLRTISSPNYKAKMSILDREGPFTTPSGSWLHRPPQGYPNKAGH